MIAARRVAAVSAVLLATVAPAALADCKAVNKVYPHGIAKNFKVIKKASGLTGRPFVSAKKYTLTLDRDGDGVDCER